MEALKIDLNNLNRYQIDTIQNTKFGVFTEQNRNSLIVEKRFSSAHKNIKFYKIKITDFKNVNPTKNQLRSIENDLNFLNDGLAISTDNYGNINDFSNLLEIRAKWEDYKYDLKKKHKKYKHLEQIIKKVSNNLKKRHHYKRSFAETEIATLLFPPDPNKISKKTKQQSTKLFTNFFEHLPLILSIHNKVEHKNEQTHLKRLGNLIDCKDYEQSIRNYFRAVHDNYKLEVKPNLKYIESFDFDNQNNITYAAQILHVHIKNVFEFQQIVNVKSLKYE